MFIYIQQNLKYFRLCGSCSLCHNCSVCFHSTEAATEKIHNEWAWLCAKKPLIYKNRWLAHGQWFADSYVRGWWKLRRKIKQQKCCGPSRWEVEVLLIRPEWSEEGLYRYVRKERPRRTGQPVLRLWGRSGSGICEEQRGGPCGQKGRSEDEQGSWRGQRRWWETSEAERPHNLPPKQGQFWG